MIWWKRIWHRKQAEADLEKELSFHLDQHAADLTSHGENSTEARRQAVLALGGREQVKEDCRDARGTQWLENLARDFRFGLRMLVKYRTASLSAIASLALAIGSCTSTFALIDALVLRPLPLPAPNQLIGLALLLPPFFSPQNVAQESNSFSFPEFELLRQQAQGRADLFAITASGGLQSAAFDDSGRASESIRANSISGAGFEILGVKPAMGRLIQPDDDTLSGGHRVAVLSYAFWRSRFGGSPTVLGHWLTLGGKQFQIIGVSAKAFSGLQPGYLTDIWLPLRAFAEVRALADPDRGSVQILGRLHEGITRSQLAPPLQAAITNFLRVRVRINPPHNLSGAALQRFANAPLHVADASRGLDSLFRTQFQRPLWVLILICLLLLLIACANVANLMLARATARESEMALRVSLGAAKFRLIQQLLIEGAQLAFLGGTLALLFAALTAPAVAGRLGSTEFPAWLNLSLGLRTISFASLLSLLAMLSIALLPAFRASSTSPIAQLKTAARQHSGSMKSLRALLTAQVCFSVALLFLSGLLLLSFGKLVAVPLGFVRDNVILFDLTPRKAASHPPDSGAKLLSEIRNLAFVQAASLSQQRPMGGDMVWISQPIVQLPGHLNEIARPIEVPVLEGFFHAMQIPWLAGHDFALNPTENVPSPVIVNRSFAEKFFPGQVAVGRHFNEITDGPAPLKRQIIGVVANSRFNNLREPEGPTIYSQLQGIGRTTLNVRTRSSAPPLMNLLRRDIESADPEVKVSSSILLASQIDNTLLTERLLALLAGFLSIVALLLTSVGLYGVINYAAVRRIREIGIRVALGAQRSSILQLVISETSTPLLAGTVLGTAAGLAMARYLASQLFEVKPTDFASLSAPLLCLRMAAAASLPPAIRAANADPLASLRHE